jgi:myosin-9
LRRSIFILISHFFLLCRPRASFPGATNETLLQKFNSVNKDNDYYEVPQKREAAFIVRHYAGKVKYQSNEFREKNLDLMKADIVAVLKSSQYAFVRELVGGDPVAVFRWAILRAFIRAYFAFIESGKRHRGEFFNIFGNFHFHFDFIFFFSF